MDKVVRESIVFCSTAGLEGSDNILPLVRMTLQERQQPVHLNCLLDSASTDSFVKVGKLSQIPHTVLESDSLINVRNLTGRTERVMDRVRLQLAFQGKIIVVEAFAVDHILRAPEVDIDLDLGKKYKMNGKFPRPELDVDLLLSVSDMWKVITDKVIQAGPGLVLFPTPWGMVPAGTGVEPTGVGFTKKETISFASATERLATLMEKMWNIETLPNDQADSTMSLEEAKAVKVLEEQLQLDEKSGKFKCGLLWKDEPDLLNNFRNANGRLNSLIRKLDKDEKMKEAYVKSIQDLIDLDVVELVEDDNHDDPTRTDVFYLPHVGVWSSSPDRASFKLRPCHDASAVAPNGKSLNQQLMAGPPILQSIQTILLKFRTGKYVGQGDLSRMFYQVLVSTVKDKDYLRWLWRENADMKNPLKIYRFKTIIFGATSSPMIANMCVRKLVQKRLQNESISEVEKRACDSLTHTLYVDDCSVIGDDEDEIVERIKSIKDILGKGSFKIRKWASNSSKILESIEEEDRSPCDTIDLGSGVQTVISSPLSLLGAKWHPKEDTLRWDDLDKLLDHKNATKQTIASFIGQCFDPLCLLCPWVLKLRKIVKMAWKHDKAWTKPLPEEAMPLYQEILEEIPQLKFLNFPRYVPINERSTLHIYSDGSLDAYAMLCYVRTHDTKTNTIHSNLLMGKNRITPLKMEPKLTVPKIELMGALLASEVAEYLVKELGIAKNKVECYSDNMTCLYWLTQNPQDKEPFVGNRVQKIQTFGFQFQYVSTAANPADIASRPNSPEILQTPLYLHGDPQLLLPRHMWKTPVVDFSKIDKNEGVKKNLIFTFATAVNPARRKIPLIKKLDNRPAVQRPVKETPMIWNEKEKEKLPMIRNHYSDPARQIHVSYKEISAMVSYYSSYRLLLRRTAILFQILHVWAKNTNGANVGLQIPIPDEYLEMARIYWINHEQREHFPDEFQALFDNKNIQKSSRLFPLTPYLDRQNVLTLDIIRVGGRLEKSDLPPETKHPPVLPKKSPLAYALARTTHVEMEHGSIDTCHFSLRQDYYILSSRQLMRSIVKSCITCRRAGGAKRAEQQMGDLPTLRLQGTEPFTAVAIDFTGDCKVKFKHDDEEVSKVYLMVAQCLTSHFLHIEVIEDKTAEATLAAFKRMLNIRGFPRKFTVYSDNAKEFKKTQSVLTSAVKVTNQTIGQDDEKYRIDWVYSPAKSPWVNGFAEAGIKACKQPLRKVAREKVLTIFELQTLCAEISGMLADRPLLQATEDSWRVITPSLLVHGRPTRATLDRYSEVTVKLKKDVRKMYKDHEKRLDVFWKNFRKNYAVEMQKRSKWTKPRPNLKVGQVVQVEAEKVKRHQWPLGRIEKVHENDRTGIVRAVDIRMEPTYVVDAQNKVTGKPGPLLSRHPAAIFPLEAEELPEDGDGARGRARD